MSMNSPQRSQPMRHTPWLLAAPALMVIFLLAVLPFILLLSLSMTDFNYTRAATTGHWNGLENYRAALADADFRAACLRTALFAAGAAALQTVVGSGVAIAIWHLGRTRRAMLSLLLTPCFVAPITVGLIARLLLHGDYGPLTQLLSRIGILQSGTVFGHSSYAFLAVLAADTWQWTPFVILIVFAALSAVPSRLVFAARIDGATPLRAFVSTTLPVILPSIILACTVRFLDATRTYDKLLVMTNGGPGASTEMLGLYLHRVAFDRGDVGTAAAMTVIGFVAVLLLSRGVAAAAWKGAGS